MKLRVTIQMKPREQYFYAVLFIMLLVLIQTFEIGRYVLNVNLMDETSCDHSNETS